MYRLLEVGEVIENGDEWYTEERGWHKSCCAGHVLRIGTPIRRLVKPDVTPAADEGYRMLSVGEKLRAGDEIYVGNWEVIVSALVGTTMKDWDKSKVRRKITPAAPSVPDPGVSVGDRVKVLTGPWAGCTGVVRSLDYPQGRTIVMDNVFVGGDRLIVIIQGKDVEPLPPVVPEVLCRDLSHGETIRQGDEIQITKQGKWGPVRSSAGTKVGNNHSDGRLYFFRRPVRLQSPGWRYLDAGETVQAGDETFCENVGFWPLPIVNGSQVNNERIFRRKLPANQGG